MTDQIDNGCNCRLCSYDREFDAIIQHVPEEHRAFFVELKDRWENADADAGWFRAHIGFDEMGDPPEGNLFEGDSA